MLLPAVLIAGDRLSALSAVAVLVIAAGIASLAFQKGALHAGNRPVLYALGTAVFIAAYTVVDGLGARETGSPHAYTLWLFAMNGLPLVAMSLLWHGRKTFAFARDNWRVGLAGGAMSLGAYWLVVWALSVAPMAQVAALRETSVVFAAILATVFLEAGDSARRASRLHAWLPAEWRCCGGRDGFQSHGTGRRLRGG